MKQFLLRTASFILILSAVRSIFSQSVKANFGYTTSCRTITPTDSSSGSTLTYFWEFGDGFTDYGKNTSHTYKLNGTYGIKLIVTCMDSGSGNFLKRDTMARQVNINCSTCNILADFSYTRDQYNVKKMAFTNKTLGQSTFTSTWEFGDTSGPNSSTNPVHTFPSEGFYNVVLKTSYYDTGLGKTCRDSTIKNIQIHSLRANFGYSIDSVNCTTVTFSDSSEGNASYYAWDFGDGYGTSTKEPTHVYSIGNGTSTQYFYVRLRIYGFDSTSGYSADTMIKLLTLPPCNICQITANIYMGGDSTIPWQGVLYNYSTGMINKHHWDFGDGNTSSSNAPTHTYAGPGKYTITYIAMDTVKNCRDTTRVTFTIDSLGFLKRKAFTLIVIDKTTTGISTIDKSNTSHLKIYPNPAGPYFNITGVQQTIDIYDLKGMKVMSFVLGTDETHTITTDGWAKGLYIVTGTAGQHLKLLIE